MYRKGLISDVDVERELGSVNDDLKTIERQEAEIGDREAQLQDLQSKIPKARTLLKRLYTALDDATFGIKREIIERFVGDDVVHTRAENGRKSAFVKINYLFNSPRTLRVVTRTGDGESVRTLTVYESGANQRRLEADLAEALGNSLARNP